MPPRKRAAAKPETPETNAEKRPSKEQRVWVRYIRAVAGVGGSHYPGEVVQVSAAEAKTLTAAQWAERVED